MHFVHILSALLSDVKALKSMLELLFSQYHQSEAHSVFCAPVQRPSPFGSNLRVARLSCSSSVCMRFPNPPPSLLPKIMLDFSEDPTKPPEQQPDAHLPRNVRSANSILEATSLPCAFLFRFLLLVKSYSEPDQ